MERPDRFIRGALALVAAASAGCLALLVIRLALGGEDALGWLAWNLLLAWAPLGLALAAALAPGSGSWSALRSPVLAVWLLLLPNAPYLVTDLVHLEGRAPAVLVIDIPLFAAFAATGLVIFLVCLHLVHRQLLASTAPRAAWALTLACVWLSCAGMYLGRVLRWNSWDLLDDPGRRLTALGAHLREPSSAAFAVAFTAGFAVCLSIAYSRFRALAAPADRPHAG